MLQEKFKQYYRKLKNNLKNQQQILKEKNLSVYSIVQFSCPRKIYTKITRKKAFNCILIIPKSSMHHCRTEKCIKIVKRFHDIKTSYERTKTMMIIPRQSLKQKIASFFCFSVLFNCISALLISFCLYAFTCLHI